MVDAPSIIATIVWILAALAILVVVRQLLVASAAAARLRATVYGR